MAKIDRNDDLAGLLADSLNKKFKDFKVAYFLDGVQDTLRLDRNFLSRTVAREYSNHVVAHGSSR